MRARRSAAVLILLAMPSSAFGQSFAPNAPRQARLTVNVSFSPIRLAVTAEPSERNAAPARINLRPSPDALWALVADGEKPCGDARTQALKEAAAGLSAHGWFETSEQARKDWDALSELIGTFFEGYQFSNRVSAHMARKAVTDLAFGTTAGKLAPPRRGRALNCAPPGR